MACFEGETPVAKVQRWQVSSSTHCAYSKRRNSEISTTDQEAFHISGDKNRRSSSLLSNEHCTVHPF